MPSEGRLVVEEQGYIAGVMRGWAKPMAFVLTLTPEQVRSSSSSRLAAGWRIWAISRFLRLRQEGSRANEWFNAAMKVASDKRDLLFMAELIGEGAISLYSSGRIADSMNMLENAEHRWREQAELIDK